MAVCPYYAGVPGNKVDKPPQAARPRLCPLANRSRLDSFVRAAESCAECGTGLSGGSVHRTGEVIDLPVASPGRQSASLL